MVLDDLLKNTESVLSRITNSKLDAYAFTQDRLRQIDVSNDRQYQKTYNGFYRVRLPITETYSTYYNLLEKNKNSKKVSLEYILNRLLEVTQRVETSFGSKLLATVNPHVAPLDSIVLKHLNLSLPKSAGQPKSSRIQQCVSVHNELVEKMNHLVTLPQFQELKKSFAVRFPGYTFTDMKILDLLLWQYRL